VGIVNFQTNRRLSLRFPLFYKWIWPLFWVGFLTLTETTLLVVVSRVGAEGKIPLIIWLGIWLSFAAYALWRQSMLVSEVWDQGDALVVRSKGMEERIALSDIERVSYQWAIRGSRRITIWLRRPCAFGDKIAFTAAFTRFLIAPSALVDELNQRKDLALAAVRRDISPMV
jgi:hypothetical protein